ncbi:MAG: hypothetical protein Hyperionvirus2_11 [Hyperionvirus sp.]|uniref:Uncharacterized protein n=1 Tax=Hyperionvirus sp. TaxID=2487770 RepID=A0A3G5A9X1_9VIRU|nr:MAG: hypothetical protein Hyperionvirus2_11 [Hyperionvirus sp.]
MAEKMTLDYRALVSKRDTLNAKMNESTEIVRTLVLQLQQARTEENRIKIALTEATEEVKQFEIEMKIGSALVQARAAMVQWSAALNKAERLVAAELYYKPLRHIVSISPLSLPLLPVTEHEEMETLLREIFTTSLHSVTITSKFDEKHLSIAIKETKEGSLDPIMVCKIIESFSLFGNITYGKFGFIAMASGSKYSILSTGAWIDKTIFDPALTIEKCTRCDKWIPICDTCHFKGSQMYHDPHVALCSDKDCQEALGYIQIDSLNPPHESNSCICT